MKYADEDDAKQMMTKTERKTDMKENNSNILMSC
jgi:hypothetical protein